MAASLCVRPGVGSLQTLASDSNRQTAADKQSLSVRPGWSFDGLRRCSNIRVNQDVASTSKKSVALNSRTTGRANRANVMCGLGDFFHADLLGNIGQWLADVENYGSVGFYSPPEGGPEGRFATSLKNEGYRLMNISARGLGDPEAYLTKVHGVRPPHLGKQAVARWYIPPEVDYRLSLLHPKDKGLVLWVGEARVLSKNELQFLALLPALRPNVKVICEMGSSRSFEWKPLKEISGLPTSTATPAAAQAPAPSPKVEASPNMVPVNSAST